MSKRKRRKKKPSGGGTVRNVPTGKLDSLGRPIYVSGVKKDKPATQGSSANPKPSELPKPAGGFTPGNMPKKKSTRTTRSVLDERYPLKGEYSDKAIDDADSYLAPGNNPNARGMRRHVENIERKHFSADSVGGTIEASSLRELLVMASSERVDGLNGNDTEELIGRGAVPGWVNSDTHRYILVDVPGKSGVKSAASLPDDTVVYLTQKSPETKPSFTVVSEREDVDCATIIIGTPPGSEEERVVTAMPGIPASQRTTIPPDKMPDFVELSKNGELTIGKVKEVLGDGNFSVLTAASADGISTWDGSVNRIKDPRVARAMERVQRRNSEATPDGGSGESDVLRGDSK